MAKNFMMTTSAVALTLMSMCLNVSRVYGVCEYDCKGVTCWRKVDGGVSSYYKITDANACPATFWDNAASANKVCGGNGGGVDRNYKKATATLDCAGGGADKYKAVNCITNGADMIVNCCAACVNQGT